MATRILVFDPLLEAEVERTAGELDALLKAGWQILSAVSGNRSGVLPELASQSVATTHLPSFKDYVVLILHNSQE